MHGCMWPAKPTKNADRQKNLPPPHLGGFCLGRWHLCCESVPSARRSAFPGAVHGTGIIKHRLCMGVEEGAARVSRARRS